MSRLAKILHRYWIWQYLITIYLAGWYLPYMVEYIKDQVRYQYRNLSGMINLIPLTIYGGIAGILLGIWVRHYRSVHYYGWTGGRNFVQDRKDTGLDYSTLMAFYDAKKDPLRVTADDACYAVGKKWTDVHGIILGQTEEGVIYKPSRADGNGLVTAPPGSGKTYSCIIPTALRFGGSILCIDIKGDIYHSVKEGMRLGKGKRRIVVFNPADRNGWHYDPFSILQNMSKSDQSLYIICIGKCLIPDENGSNAAYFVEKARQFWTGICLYLLDQTIAAGESLAFIDAVQLILDGSYEAWVSKVLQDGSERARMWISSIQGENEKNAGSGFDKLASKLRVFTLGSCATLLREKPGKTITPELLEKGIDIYIRIEQKDLTTYGSLAGMIAQGFMLHFMDRPDKVSGKKVRPILFMLDEFPQLHMDSTLLDSALSTLRSKGVSLELVTQSISQIYSQFGKDGTGKILGNIIYICCMGQEGYENAKPLSQEFGTHLELRRSFSRTSNGSLQTAGSNIQTVETPRFRPETIMALRSMGKHGKVLIKADGHYILSDKVDWKH